MLFLSIPNPSLIAGNSSAMEWRIDLFPNIDFASIRNFLQEATSPVMLTLRKKSQGGKFSGTEKERESVIERLLELAPPLFDLEYDMDSNFLKSMIEKYPNTKFIISYHNFDETPFDLESLSSVMHKIPAFSYKIAAMALSTNDALRMLLLAKKYPKVSVICMGKKGEFARVLAPIVGNLVNYACLNEDAKTGPGQLSIEELTTIYHYSQLNTETKIYGLIGNPIEKSPGHLYHNAVLRNLACKAVYVKMEVEPDELKEFIPLALALGIQGLSITIPLKEKILPWIHEFDPSVIDMGAINTLKITNGRIYGTNTDGHGAIEAIEKKISLLGKKVVIIGAGGAARAIAFVALMRGANIVILNRSVERAQELAKTLGCTAGSLEEVPTLYDCLINCCPDPMPIQEESIIPGILAMDVVYSPRETPFLTAAIRKKCQIVYGEEMYVNQARKQTSLWFNECM